MKFLIKVVTLELKKAEKFKIYFERLGDLFIWDQEGEKKKDKDFWFE